MTNGKIVINFISKVKQYESGIKNSIQGLGWKDKLKVKAQKIIKRWTSPKARKKERMKIK